MKILLIIISKSKAKMFYFCYLIGCNSYSPNSSGVNTPSSTSNNFSHEKIEIIIPKKYVFFLPVMMSTELVLGFEVVEDASEPGGLFKPQHFSAMC